MISLFFLMIFIVLAFLSHPLLKKSTTPIRANTLCAIALIIILPVGSILLYMYLGSPELVK